MILKVFLSTFLTLCCFFSLNGATYFVSLGIDCQVAYTLEELKLRPTSFPLDWVASDNFEGVIRAFEDDFKYFLNPNYLSYQIHPSPYIGSYIWNSYYEFRYSHFFPTINDSIVYNYLDFLPDIRNTQNRRVQRLISLMKSKNDVIVFIRTNIEPGEAYRFVDLIHKKYPNLFFLLVAVNERKDFAEDWNLERVLNFYITNKRKDLYSLWWDHSEWLYIIDSVYKRISLLKLLGIQ